MPHLVHLRMGAFLPSQDLASVCRRSRLGVSVTAPVPSKALSARSVAAAGAY